MLQVRVKSIRDSVVQFCKKQGIKFSNKLYRKAKREYILTPKKERTHFVVA